MHHPIAAVALCALLTSCHTSRTREGAATRADAGGTVGAMTTPPSKLDLGAFSVSLAVKDLAASRAFYEKLGFEPFAGDPAQNWQILRNGNHVIGLFQGMFETNILTFNPGWSQQATPVTPFTDVREIQARLQKHGLTLASAADPASTGPASLMVIDPDGNPVLIDQHVPKGK